MGTPEYFFYLLFLAARRRDLALDEALAPTGLTVARWRTLAIIRRIEGCVMSALSRFSTVERTTLTRAVDQLVEQGLVVRWVPDHDRRQVCLALTEEGETVYASAIASLLAFNRRSLDGMEPEHVRTATRALQTVLGNVVADEALSLDLIGFGRSIGVSAF